MFTKFSKLLWLFTIGGMFYGLIEIIYRNYTHWTMIVLGGILFLIIGEINELLDWDIPLIWQSLLGALTITVAEFIFGVILNIWLGLGIWDYSNLPYNILGQICPQFTLIWIPTSTFAIVVDDWLRYWIWDEEKPRYYIF